MQTKLSKSEVDQRIIDAGRGIKMVGALTNVKTKTLFECIYAHQWEAMPYKIMGGGGCPVCANAERSFSTNHFHSLLEKDSRGITLIGKYINANTKTTFGCSLGHQWDTTPNSVLWQGTGCPYCNSFQHRLSTDKFNDWLIERGEGITLISEYTGALTKSTFSCVRGHFWDALPNNIRSGSGCPICNVGGGFDVNEPGWEYVLDFGYFLKFGITNNLSNRLESHKKNGKYKVVHERYHELGLHARDWEHNIKQVYGGRFVTKNECPDGYTETLPIHLLEHII